MSDKVRVRDIEVNYRVMGEGSPLVMIMGLTASMETWEPGLLEALSRRYRVVVFDNRGAGLTDAPPGDFSMKQFADDTAGLMEALGVERGYVLGESMGGMVAQEVALNHPGLVEKLVLCCTFCGGEQAVFPEQKVIQILLDREGSPEEIVRRGIPIIFPDDWVASNPGPVEEFVKRGLVNPISAENALRQGQAIFGFSTYDRLPHISCPTLIACGTADVLVPPRNSRILAERINGSRLIEYAGGGHGFTAQLRDEFLGDLTAFLD